MERDDERIDDVLIELGQVSIETKGPPILVGDQHGGNAAAGLSND